MGAYLALLFQEMKSLITHENRIKRQRIMNYDEGKEYDDDRDRDAPTLCLNIAYILLHCYKNM